MVRTLNTLAASLTPPGIGLEVIHDTTLDSIRRTFT